VGSGASKAHLHQSGCIISKDATFSFSVSGVLPFVYYAQNGIGLEGISILTEFAENSGGIPYKLPVLGMVLKCESYFLLDLRNAICSAAS
jgi:hypothetical protein